MSSIIQRSVPVSSVRDTQSGIVFNPQIKIFTVTGVTCAGKNYTAKVLQRAYGFNLIRSVTTRPRRENDEEEQDSEYEHVTEEKFQRMKHQGDFLWSFQHLRTLHWYGTRKRDITQALKADIPSVMHLVHDKVEYLQQYAINWCRQPSILSAVVICSDEGMLRMRYFKREKYADPEEANRRFQGISLEQAAYLSTPGLYHFVIESHDSKTGPEILEEITPHLQSPIPETLNP